MKYSYNSIPSHQTISNIWRHCGSKIAITRAKIVLLSLIQIHITTEDISVKYELKVANGSWNGTPGLFVVQGTTIWYVDIIFQLL